jgi:hypothetical protein
LQLYSEKFAGISLGCLALCVSACSEPEPGATVETLACGADGALTAEIYGGVRASLDWDAGMLECEGMPRPDGDGARLRFAGPADPEDEKLRLVFILGLSDLVEGETASELPTNVTLMEEGTGRIFGTRYEVNCWTDIDLHEPIQPAVSSTYTIGGVLYCVKPLINLNGSSNISFAELEFTGQLDWELPQ